MKLTVVAERWGLLWGEFCTGLPEEHVPLSACSVWESTSWGQETCETHLSASGNTILLFLHSLSFKFPWPQNFLFGVPASFITFQCTFLDIPPCYSVSLGAVCSPLPQSLLWSQFKDSLNKHTKRRKAVVKSNENILFFFKPFDALLTGSYWRPLDVIMVSAKSRISAPTSADIKSTLLLH